MGIDKKKILKNEIIKKYSSFQKPMTGSEICICLKDRLPGTKKKSTLIQLLPLIMKGLVSFNFWQSSIPACQVPGFVAEAVSAACKPLLLKIPYCYHPLDN